MSKDAVPVGTISLSLNQRLMIMIRLRSPIFPYFLLYPYLPTPPLGQDMTQGQFLSGV